MIKVLYACEDYPIHSETYVETELDYVLGRGVEAAVWCRDVDPHRGAARIQTFDGPLPAAIKAFKPDIIHAHWLDIAQAVVQHAGGTPVTIRAHSFDYHRQDVRALMLNTSVKVLWIFPWLRDLFFKSSSGSCFRGSSLESKVRALPCAYNESLYYPEPKIPGTVFRASAGLPSKDLECFVRVAKLTPEAKFTLVISKPKRINDAMNNLKGLNAKLGYPVELLEHVPREEVAALSRKSQICFRSHDANAHYYGMPISIAEAMATGAAVVARDGAGARSYLGDAGLFFKEDREASNIIRELVGSPEKVAASAARSIERARTHASAAVLPEILGAWHSISGK